MLTAAWNIARREGSREIQLSSSEEDGSIVYRMSLGELGKKLSESKDLLATLDALGGDSQALPLRQTLRIIRRHGGRLWAEEDADGRSTLCFTFAP